MSSPMDSIMQKRKRKMKGTHAEQHPQKEVEMADCELGASPVISTMKQKKWFNFFTCKSGLPGLRALRSRDSLRRTAQTDPGNFLASWAGRSCLGLRSPSWSASSQGFVQRGMAGWAMILRVLVGFGGSLECLGSLWSWRCASNCFLCFAVLLIIVLMFLQPVCDNWYTVLVTSFISLHS